MTGSEPQDKPAGHAVSRRNVMLGVAALGGAAASGLALPGGASAEKPVPGPAPAPPPKHGQGVQNVGGIFDIIGTVLKVAEVVVGGVEELVGAAATGSAVQPYNIGGAQFNSSINRSNLEILYTVQPDLSDTDVALSFWNNGFFGSSEISSDQQFVLLENNSSAVTVTDVLHAYSKGNVSIYGCPERQLTGVDGVPTLVRTAKNWATDVLLGKVIDIFAKDDTRVTLQVQESSGGGFTAKITFPESANVTWASVRLTSSSGASAEASWGTASVPTSQTPQSPQPTSTHSPSPTASPGGSNSIVLTFGGWIDIDPVIASIETAVDLPDSVFQYSTGVVTSS